MSDIYEIAKDIALLQSRVGALERRYNNLESVIKPKMGFVPK